jgi:hypothetical protein
MMDSQRLPVDDPGQVRQSKGSAPPRFLTILLPCLQILPGCRDARVILPTDFGAADR